MKNCYWKYLSTLVLLFSLGIVFAKTENIVEPEFSVMDHFEFYEMDDLFSVYTYGVYSLSNDAYQRLSFDMRMTEAPFIHNIANKRRILPFGQDATAGG